MVYSIATWLNCMGFRIKARDSECAQLRSEWRFAGVNVNVGDTYDVNDDTFNYIERDA